MCLTGPLALARGLPHPGSASCPMHYFTGERGEAPLRFQASIDPSHPCNVQYDERERTKAATLQMPWRCQIAVVRLFHSQWQMAPRTMVARHKVHELRRILSRSTRIPMNSAYTLPRLVRCSARSGCACQRRMPVTIPRPNHLSFVGCNGASTSSKLLLPQTTTPIQPGCPLGSPRLS